MFQPEKSNIITIENARDFFLSQEYKSYPPSQLTSAKFFLQKKILDVPKCNTNDSKVCINVEIYEIYDPSSPITHKSVELSLMAESTDEVWFKISAYGLRFEELEEKIKSVEERLVASWRACYKG